jgi:hypothetical protein
MVREATGIVGALAKMPLVRGEKVGRVLAHTLSVPAPFRRPNS